MSEKRMLDADFLDLITYGMCKAISKTVGTEEATKVLRLAGEVNFDELRKFLATQETDPVRVLRKVANYLEDVGYMKKINVIKTAENRLTIEMYDAVVSPRTRRLLAEGFAPPHYMTNIMFGALKEMCGLTATLDHMEVGRPTREYWILKQIEQK